MKRVSQLGLLALAASPHACALSREEAETVGELHEAASCEKDATTGVTIYVSPNGSDSGSGTCDAPFKTLAKAHDYIDAQDPDVDGERINSKSYTVYLRGGGYARAKVLWRVASETRQIRITAYPGARPILDGKGEIDNAIEVSVGRGKKTMIEISGLTFRHYVMRGILLRGGYNGNNAADKPFADGRWNGGGEFFNNVFERIGDVYNNVCLELGRDRCLQATPLPDEDIARVVCRDSDGEVCAGRAGIGGFNTRHNKIHDNVFSYIESADDNLWQQGHSRQVAHAFYVSTFSSGNELRNNYVTYSSGSAFKLVNRSGQNIIANNYITFSGSHAFIENLGPPDPDDPPNNEAPGLGNQVISNIMVFGYPYRDSLRSRSSFVVAPYRVEPGFPNHAFQESGADFHEGRRPRYERIGGLALGDVDGDQRNELFVAFNYPEFGISTIAKTGLAGGGQYPNRIVFRSKEREVNGLAVGKFEAGGPASLISNLHRVEAGVDWTELYRGSGRDNIGSGDLGRLYSNDHWLVTALATGDFDDNGVDELLTAFKSDSGTRRIYRGAGTSDVGSSIYESTIWDVPAMAALRASGADTLYTAFERSTSSGYESRVYRGNGVTSVTGGGNLVTLPDQSLSGLAVSSNPGRFYAGVAHGDGHTLLRSHTLEGDFVEFVDTEPSGKFTHLVYGAVGSGGTGLIMAHETLSFVAGRPVSKTEIRNASGVVFHTFTPAPHCDPDIWECD